MLAGRRVQHATVDLYLDVAGQKLRQQLFFLRFVYVFAARFSGFFGDFLSLRRFEGQKAEAAPGAAAAWTQTRPRSATPRLEQSFRRRK